MPVAWPAEALRTRTTLTTSPSGAPVDALASGEAGEYWYPALALPSEPALPSRFRPWAIGLLVISIVLASLYGAWRITQRGTNFDPALDREVEAAPFDAVTFLTGSTSVH